jgi:hypothetical protein
MIVACPSCEKPFDADDEIAGGPGLPLCDDCSSAVRVPRGGTESASKGLAPPRAAPRPAQPVPKPAPSTPDDRPRRRRPKAPDINFGPRRSPDDDAPPSEAEAPLSNEPPAAPDPGAFDLEARWSEPEPKAPTPVPAPAPVERAKVTAGEPPPSSRGGERLSLGEIAPRSSGGPTVLDGGFDPLAGEAEPVSLHDLGLVLAPVAAPPPWSGTPRPPLPSDPLPEEASPAVRIPAPAKPKIRAAYAPVPKRRGSTPEPFPAPVVAARGPTPIAKVAEAPPKKTETRKPSFFQVDTNPPPSVDVPVDVEEPPRSSGHEDLRRLIASAGDRGKKRADADLLSLRGALFTEATKPAPLPADLAVLLSLPEEAPRDPTPPEAAPVAHPPAPRPAPPAPADTRSDEVAVQTSPPTPAPAPPPRPEPVVSRGARRTAPTGLVTLPAPEPPPEPPPPARAAFMSGAPGPVVSERRPAVAAAVRRSGIASWAVAVASLTTVVLVVALRFGASTDASGNDAPAPSAVAKAPPTVARVAPDPPILAEHPAHPQPPATISASPPPPVEPARTVVERPVAAPSPPPPPTTVAAATPAPSARPAAPPEPPPPKPKPAPEPSESEVVFNRDAARAALATAAGGVAGCRQADDPTGVAKVSIVFAPSGRVTSARVTGAPFQGTRIGACIASTFRTVSVPPFGGDPVSVSKDVVIR